MHACTKPSPPTLRILWTRLLNVTQQRTVLKALSKNFQREIKAIYDGSFVSQLCRDSRQLTENAKNRSCSTTSIPRVERWRMRAGTCFSPSAFLFSTTTFENEKKNMNLDGKLALNDVSFNKSDFNHIPVVARSALDGRLPHTTGENKWGESVARYGSSAQAHRWKSDVQEMTLVLEIR
jgi:hypothetical protein